jgi:MscS family membrane protein
LLLIYSAFFAWRTFAQSGVELMSPADGARFNPRSNISLRADVNPNLGRLKRIEFVADGHVISVITNAYPPYTFVWNSVAPGTYKVFARAVPQTGDSVESKEIYIRVYNALLTFGLDRIPALDRNKLFNIPLWQYCASLLYIFLAFYISKILDYLTRVWLKRWTTRTKTQFDDLVLDLLNGPTKIIAFMIFLRIGLDVFSWPLVAREFLTKAFIVIIAISITYMILKFIDLVMGYWKKRTRPDADRTFEEQLFPIIRKSLKVFVVVVAALVTLDNIGVNITAAIASLSIGGLAVGLAAQDTLANLFGAVAVFVDKPFRIGDRIQLDSVDGSVESIGLRSTRVRNPDGHLITVPNKTMGNATITNVTRRPHIKTEMNIGLTYEMPPEKIRRALAILEEIYRGHPMTENLVIGFNKFADSALNILVVHWWKGTDHKAYLAGMQELNLVIKERFDAEGIAFAFPSKTVYLKQDSDWRLKAAGN